MQTASIQSCGLVRTQPSGFCVRSTATDRDTSQLKDTVYLIGRDENTNEGAALFLQEVGIDCVTCASEEGYLSLKRRDSAGCLILDVALSGADGLALQKRFMLGQHPPLVFISGQCDVRSTVSAIKAGAVEVFPKPVDLPTLLSAVRTAFALDRRARHRRAELNLLQQLYALLTPREREVLPLVVGGLLNKQSAALLDISEVTLQIHRSQVMKKMKANSFAELVRMAVKLRIQHWREDRMVQESA